MREMPPTPTPVVCNTCTWGVARCEAKRHKKLTMLADKITLVDLAPRVYQATQPPVYIVSTVVVSAVHEATTPGPEVEEAG